MWFNAQCIEPTAFIRPQSPLTLPPPLRRPPVTIPLKDPLLRFSLASVGQNERKSGLKEQSGSLRRGTSVKDREGCATNTPSTAAAPFTHSSPVLITTPEDDHEMDHSVHRLPLLPLFHQHADRFDTRQPPHPDQPRRERSCRISWISGCRQTP